MDNLQKEYVILWSFFVNKTVCVIGLGYIGLPTAAILSQNNFKVLGIDIDQNAIKKIKKGVPHFQENGLDEIVKTSIDNGNLSVSDQCKHSDIFIIAVPTPFYEEEGRRHADLQYISSAIKSLAPYLEKNNLIILESTSPVGTTKIISELLEKERDDLIMPHKSNNPDINIAYCPERVLPGKILYELKNNDRVVGGITSNCTKKARKFYEDFVEGEILETNSDTAEMVKLAENSFRDNQIAFANELSILSDKLNVDVWELIKLANRHPRVEILQPGPGVGGHCIAVDPWFLISGNEDITKLIKTARDVNEYKKEWVIEKIYSKIQECESKDTLVIAIFGIAFKANVDDLRESPSFDIAKVLTQDKSLKVLIVEPNIDKLPKSISNAELCTIEQALKKSDLNVLLVDHKEFETLKMQNYNFFDTKGQIK